jgi:hypothetical protein
MIRRIFDDVSHDAYSDAAVRAAFGLGQQKSTFSRFAGSRWSRRSSRASGSQLVIPALWANVAETLASHPAFAEAIAATGLGDAIQEVLHARRSRGGRGGHRA